MENAEPYQREESQSLKDTEADRMILFQKTGDEVMILTKNNLHEVIFENQDAKLLIQDVVEHTGAILYYYHGIEITVQAALSIWRRACSLESEDFEEQALPAERVTRVQMSAVQAFA